MHEMHESETGRKDDMATHIFWRPEHNKLICGYLRGHPETTLFILELKGNDQATLSGAFIPDADENEIFTIEDGKQLAELYLMEWYAKAKVALG
jgi:hypothetical protein